jgi:pSer/pThr/pTyr-binding forkhead associated (FHA) protein
MTAAAYVVTIHGPDGVPPRTEPILKPRTVIGRVNGDILLQDPLCSTTHAELLLEGATLRIRDLGSTNGTSQDGKPVTDMIWLPGTKIQIGGHELELEDLAVAPVLGPKGTMLIGKEALAVAPDPSYFLVIQAPNLPPVTEEIYRPRSVIGRTEGDIILSDMRCSSTHAEILFDGAAVKIRDLGSSNGTWLGQERVTDMLWQPGVVLEIGSHKLELREIRTRTQPAAVGAPAPKAAAPPSKPARKGTGSTPRWLIPGAVLLGICLLGLGLLKLLDVNLPGFSTGGPQLLSEAREATVQFVWFNGQAGASAAGGTAPVRIRLSPNRTGTVSVGVSEEYAGGGGNQWRTAVWLAAFNATRTMGASITDCEFNVHVSGHTDGPSAGMLTTAAMLALLRGKEIRQDTTMTGTINPDGTAGPVAGIVQKMEGAKQAGLKRFGFPLGSRNQKDQKTGQDVDLLQVGQKLGLEVVEIGELDEAYEFLTRDKLPRTEPISEAAMEPTMATQTLLRTKLATWKSRIEREAAGFKSAAKSSGVPPQVYAPLLADADRIFETAKRDERNGFLMPALQGYVQTVISFTTATRTAAAYAQMIKGDQAGLLDAIQGAAAINGEVTAFGQQLEIKALNHTRGGQINSSAAFTTYVKARAAALIADDFAVPAVAVLKGIQAKKIQLKTENLGTLMTRITLPLHYYDLAKVQLEFAREMQDFIAEEGDSKPLKAKSVDRAVTSYASVSTAVLAYFDALITEEVAKGKGLSMDEAKAQIANREADYYLAQKAKLLAESRDKTSDGAKLINLAAAGYAFLDGAKLVNKWYSLGAAFDDRGGVILENRRALTAQLDLARRNAREAAARAMASAGFVPAPARLAYQVGNARREGNDEEKLAALASYWQASLWSELAATANR